MAFYHSNFKRFFFFFIGNRRPATHTRKVGGSVAQIQSISVGTYIESSSSTSRVLICVDHFLF